MNAKSEDLKRNDQICLLEVCAKFTETGKWEGLFSYPNCGYDLVQQGFVTEDKKITQAGKAALWLLNKGPDQTTSEVVKVFSFRLDKQLPEERDYENLPKL